MTAELRCAALARAEGYLPAGSAASAAAFLLIELPLPWPSEITEHPALQEVAPIAASHRARVQGLVPDPAVAAVVPGRTRVVLYRRPPDPFLRFHRQERVVPTEELAPEVEQLLVAAMEDGPEDGPVDVLVCTHGSRDVCCGGDGLRTHRGLTALALPGVRVWRTSHTGGHRFAPTAVTFPDGRAWARVDAETLAALVTRSLDPGTAARHDRGCAGFSDPFVQAADSAALAAEGWRWLDLPRVAESVVGDESRRTVTLTAVGEPVGYRAEVIVRRVVPVPDCGRPLSEARKSSQELEVVALTRV
jgi:hypothetical protein